jgi:hypothetical protein
VEIGPRPDLHFPLDRPHRGDHDEIHDEILSVRPFCVCVCYHHLYITSYYRASTDKLAESSTLAEEVISTVRTAQAFGTQRTLSSKYEDYLMRGKDADFMVALFQGAGMGSMFFAVYGCYSLSV